MPIDAARVSTLLATADDVTLSTTARGRAVEDLIEHIFGAVPGITHPVRDRLNAFNSEEVDLALWNACDRAGFYFLPNILLIESKNWTSKVGSAEVDWFISKLRRRGQSVGILVALRGITGDPEQVSSARHMVASALQEGFKVIVVSRSELLAILTPAQLVLLLQTKLMELVVSGTSL